MARNTAQLSNPVSLGSTESRSMEITGARTFLESMRGHDHQALFVVLLTTGLRISEALALSWSDVDAGELPSRPCASTTRSSAQVDSG